MHSSLVPRLCAFIGTGRSEMGFKLLFVFGVLAAIVAYVVETM